MNNKIYKHIIINKLNNYDWSDEPIEKTKTKPAHAKPNTDNFTSSINKYRFV